MADPTPVQDPTNRTAEPAFTDAGVAAATAQGRIGTGFGVWIRDLIISLAISAFIIIFLYQPVKVEGTSMMPLARRPGTHLREQVRVSAGTH